jgi:hypothetical protein
MPVLGPLEGGPSGPTGRNQTGQGSKGQYVYWIVMVHPTPAVLSSHGLKKPDAYTREKFGKLMTKVHKECGVKIVETACFLEPHANGLMVITTTRP